MVVSARTLAVAVLVGWLSACSSPEPTVAAREFGCTSGPPVFPEYESQELLPIRIRDFTGTITGCRWIGLDESTALIPTLDPPLPAGLPPGRVHVAQAPATDESLILLWATEICDSDASVILTGVTTVSHLEVDQHRSGDCGAGTAPVWLELSAESRVEARNIGTAFFYTER
jgi:hypothetical protein